MKKTVQTKALKKPEKIAGGKERGGGGHGFGPVGNAELKSPLGKITGLGRTQGFRE